jgi:hypothetical protein
MFANRMVDSLENTELVVQQEGITGTHAVALARPTE